MKTHRNGLCAIAFALLILIAVSSAQAQLSPKLQAAVGGWQVVHNDGKPGGQVEIYLVNGKLFGKVTQLVPGRQPGDLCNLCSGELKNQPLIGMVIFRNFSPDGDVWDGGTVVDPENGKIYKGKVWTVGQDKLSMRGFVGFSLLGRTETWTRLP
jgi:uncharacterized protein (DUF2147 family)